MTTAIPSSATRPLTIPELQKAVFAVTASTSGYHVRAQRMFSFEEAFPFLLINGRRFDFGVAENPYVIENYVAPKTDVFWQEAGATRLDFELLLPFCNIVSKHMMGNGFISLSFETRRITSAWFDPRVYFQSEADGVVMSEEYLRDTVFKSRPPLNLLHHQWGYLLEAGVFPDA